LTTTDWYLAAAEMVVDLVGDQAVAERWAQPSALAGMSVGALAEHLARQLFTVESVLDQEPCDQEPVALLDHYGRVSWIPAGHDEEPNVSLRENAAAAAQEGPAALLERTRAATTWLAERLPGERPDRVLMLTWQPWPLTLEDLLVTRLMEIAVHGDDLAYSVGVRTPALPVEATDVVVTLLARLAARRHGPTAVIRALSRAERAPETIAAF